MTGRLNQHYAPDAVPPPSREAAAFHASLPGYGYTPLHVLDDVADELALGSVFLKDESDRLGLPAFKVLGASWAVEQALRRQPDLELLVAASAGNHGRAVAHVAAQRGLACRIFLPERSAAARRAAVAAEGAEVVVVDGSYEEAVAEAAAAAAAPHALEVADVGASDTARWVVDGYATLFTEIADEEEIDLLLVPAGVGSLAAAAARFGAANGVAVVAVEPRTAACVTASLQAGTPVEIETPGTTMAGLDCAEVSEAAWPDLRDGLAGTIVVDDAEAHAAMRELAALGYAIGDCGAAPLAALRALATDPGCAALRAGVGLGASTRVGLVATEGPTDPDGYRSILGR